MLERSATTFRCDGVGAGRDGERRLDALAWDEALYPDLKGQGGWSRPDAISIPDKADPRRTAPLTAEYQASREEPQGTSRWSRTRHRTPTYSLFLAWIAGGTNGF